MHERRSQGGEAESARGYFPGDVLSPGDDSGAEFRDRWYSPHLLAMAELRLAEAGVPEGEEVFRLTVLPAFTRPVAVRLHRRGESAAVVTTVLSGMGGYEPGEVLRRDSAEVPADEAAEFFRRAEGAGFWSMPVQGEDVGLDGSQWILEGARGGCYHVADRWAPDYTGGDPAFLELANELLRLAGVDLAAVR